MTTGDGLAICGVMWLIANTLNIALQAWQWKQSRPQAKAYDNVDERLHKVERTLSEIYGEGV